MSILASTVADTTIRGALRELSLEEDGTATPRGRVMDSLVPR